MARGTTKDVLVLQGGGALGAYQAGAFEALDASGRPTDWVAGVSIGAINAALIAGNPPEQRAERLRAFWHMVGQSNPLATFTGQSLMRGALNEFSAEMAALYGVPGFFRPRIPPAFVRAPGTDGANSFYDTAPLQETLKELVDFDYLNDGAVRFSTGAVNVETGNVTWFDNTRDEILPEHVMASGALPPGFPPVEIGGQFFWDGGLVSNTPLQFVFDERSDEDLCIFQIDLFSARGRLPQSVWQAEARAKDIRFSSRTRFNTDMLRHHRQVIKAGRRLYEKLPPELQNDPDALSLLNGNCDPGITIIHLIYRQTRYESQTKDYNFAHASVADHWAAGARDVERTLAHPEWRAYKPDRGKIQVFDLTNANPDKTQLEPERKRA